MLRWFSISCICDQYIDVAFVTGLVEKESAMNKQ